MPLFMDRHDIRDATAEDVAAAHHQDLAVQGRHSCRALTYWYDESRGAAFCLVEAPSAAAVQEMHRDAHGLIPNQVIEVDPTSVAQFLGRVADPVGTADRTIVESAFRALLFVDLASSSDLTNLLGDSAALALMQRYREIVRNALVDHSGREIDRAGDGFLTSFESASTAVSCAITIQKELAMDNETRDSSAGLHARIGIGAGEPVMDGEALFGSTVNLTARICAQADLDQILVSRVVKDLCLGKGLSFSPIGAHELKGFEAPVELELVHWD